MATSTCSSNNLPPSLAGKVITSVIEQPSGDYVVNFSDGTNITLSQGAKGWSPVLVNEISSDADNIYVRWKIVDYVGGTGDKPTLPSNPYIGTGGYTTFSLAQVTTIPKEKFTIDAQGPSKVAYNLSPKDFVFYDNSFGNPDSGKVFFKLSNALGDWSLGFLWRGPSGPTVSSGQNIRVSLAGEVSVKYHFEPVQTVSELESIDTTDITVYPDLGIILVRDQGLYYLDSTSVATPDGVDVIEALGGGGNWLRVPVGSGGSGTLVDGRRYITLDIGNVNQDINLTTAATGTETVADYDVVFLQTSQAGPVNVTSIIGGVDEKLYEFVPLTVDFVFSQGTFNMEGQQSFTANPGDRITMFKRVLSSNWFEHSRHNYGPATGAFVEATLADSTDVLDISGVIQSSLSTSRLYTPRRFRDFIVGLLNRANTWTQKQLFTLGLGGSFWSGSGDQIGYFNNAGDLLRSTVALGDLQVAFAITGVTYVSKNGNDASGIVGRIDKPFITIQAAINASPTNSQIIVFPGTYTENLTIPGGAGAKKFFIDLTGTNLVGNITYGASGQAFSDGNVLYGNGSSSITGKIIANASGFENLYIDNFVTLSNTSDTLFANPTSAAGRFRISRIRQIQTTNSGVFGPGTYFINNVEFITANRNIIPGNTAVSFEEFYNVGLVENTEAAGTGAGYIYLTNSITVNLKRVKNVTFKSNNHNFNLWVGTHRFFKCYFYSATGNNFYNATPNGNNLTLESCLMQTNGTESPVRLDSSGVWRAHNSVFNAVTFNGGSQLLASSNNNFSDTGFTIE